MLSEGFCAAHWVLDEAGALSISGFYHCLFTTTKFLLFFLLIELAFKIYSFLYLISILFAAYKFLLSLAWCYVVKLSCLSEDNILIISGNEIDVPQDLSLSDTGC